VEKGRAKSKEDDSSEMSFHGNSGERELTAVKVYQEGAGVEVVKGSFDSGVAKAATPPLRMTHCRDGTSPG
jgi:hypothetical protein